MTGQKFWDLDAPPVVAVVGCEDATGALRSTLAAETEFRIEAVDDASGIAERLADAPAVECLWLTDRFGDRNGDVDLPSIVEDVRAADPATTVVAAPTAGSERLASLATAAGADEYVAADAALEERVERVRQAVDRGVARRHDATKRSVLDTMLQELGVTLFAKDDQARHVLYSERENAPDPEAVVGKTDIEVYDPEYGNIREAYRDDRSVIQDGARIDGKVETVAEVGQGWMWVKKVPWEVDGEIRGLVGLSINITDWKERERDLVRKVGRLQQLPDYLVHDLRNPLGIARGYLGLARDGDPQAIETVEDSVDRMEELLEDFHSLASQGTNAETDVRPVDVEAVVRDLWRYVSSGVAQLEIDFLPGTRLVADEGQLRPLLKNLLGNAVDHAGPEVTVRVGQLEDGFFVEDDGPGIPRELRGQVFEQGMSSDRDGTGLGLAIVQEAAMLHDWEVSVGDSESGGARFEVRGCLIGSGLDDVAPTGESVALTDACDVGDVGTAGSVDPGGDSIVVSGAGSNVWSYDNAFHFYHGAAPDGVRIQGRLVDMEPVEEYSKAGFMIRSSLDEDASYAFVGSTQGTTPEVLWRSAPGERGRSAQIGGVDSSLDWFRVDRLGNDVCLSISEDGERWTPVARKAIAFGTEPLVGIAVCSTVDDELVDAEFEAVDVLELER